MTILKDSTLGPLVQCNALKLFAGILCDDGDLSQFDNNHYPVLTTVLSVHVCLCQSKNYLLISQGQQFVCVTNSYMVIHVHVYNGDVMYCLNGKQQIV